jgi:hypothetical protein
VSLCVFVGRNLERRWGADNVQVRLTEG